MAIEYVTATTLPPPVHKWMTETMYRIWGNNSSRRMTYFERIVTTESRDNMTIVAVEDRPGNQKAVLGYASLVKRAVGEERLETPWLAYGYVIPDRRGRKLFYHLQQHIESFARAGGHQDLFVHATRMYLPYWKAQGYQVLRGSASVVVDGVQNFILSKPLKRM